MTSITYVGMDVHTTNFTLCCYSMEDDQVYAVVQIEPDYREILKYLKRVEENQGDSCEFVCGYEAGCLGYSLYHQLSDHGVKCVILAPSTMPSVPGKQIKTDRRDAANISKCLAYHTYSAVYVPTEDDDAVKEYIRMRDDVKNDQKRAKQQIIAFCTRHGKVYDGKSYWTQKHISWLQSLKFDNRILQETLQEYMALYFQLTDKLKTFDARIEEMSHLDQYEEKVKQLRCFSGISTHTAMSLIAEVGDFKRFKSAQQFSSFLGLVPSEYSSGDKRLRSGITKAGNSHLRRLLVEAAQSYSKGAVGKKSELLKRKQAGNPTEIIAYADRANCRLKRKFYRIALRSKHNIAKTAVARELACFVWGMMTGNIA